jgi:type VI secretion system protein ImpH
MVEQAQDHPVEADPIAALVASAPRLEFFQLVRLLERGSRGGAGESDDAGPEAHSMVGTDAMPAREAVRFAAAPSLSFAATQVQAIRKSSLDGQPLEVVVNFLGLIGPAGVLPRHYTANAIARVRDKDESLVRFLDLFQSRLLGLFYRSFARYQAAVAFEGRQRRPDLLTLLMRSIVGFDESGPRAGQLAAGGAAEHDVLGFAGLYGHSLRPASALEQMLAAQLRLPVRIEQFSGQWLMMPPDQRSALPSRSIGSMRSGIHNRLGANAVLGDRVWDVASRLGARIGPLSFEQYLQFVPSGAGLRRAGTLARLYVRLEFDLLVRPVLKQESVPCWQLNSRAPLPQLLGRTIWLRSENRPFTRDFDDAAYVPPD